MNRCWVLLELVEDEIYPVALAMLDGSYWKEDRDPQIHQVDPSSVQGPLTWD